MPVNSVYDFLNCNFRSKNLKFTSAVISFPLISSPLDIGCGFFEHNPADRDSVEYVLHKQGKKRRNNALKNKPSDATKKPRVSRLYQQFVACVLFRITCFRFSSLSYRKTKRSGCKRDTDDPIVFIVYPMDARLL